LLSKKQFERTLEKIQESKDISDENREIIFKFKDYLLSDNIGIAKINRYLLDLIKFDGMAKKPFPDVNKADLRAIIGLLNQTTLAEETKKGFKIMLRKLYRFIEGVEEKGVYPERVKWISITIQENHKKLPEELLTEEEIEKIIRHTQNVRDKALISTLAESGCRVGEIGSMQIKHVSFEEHGARLTVTGKTGMRKILVINSTPYLQEWINQHPQNNDLNGYSIMGEKIGDAIVIDGHDSLIVKNGIISNFSDGIVTLNSNNNIIKDLEFYYNDRSESGILIINSENNLIKNNFFNLNDGGVYIVGGSNNIIIDNIITNSWAGGISLKETFNNEVNNNILLDNKIDLIVNGYEDSHCNNIVTNNICSEDKPIIFYNSKVEVSNLDVSEMILCNADNSIISNVKIDNEKQSNGLFIIKTENASLSNIFVNNSAEGISTRFSYNNTFTDIISSNNARWGIKFMWSDNNYINRGDFSFNLGNGILLHDSSYNEIKNTHVENNQIEGICFEGESINSIIYNNLFNNNQNIDISSSDINLWNTSLKSGINIVDGSFIGGNYWINPDGTGFSQICEDLDKDGICDSFYELDENNIDYFPLTISPLNVEIIMPQDNSIIKGDFFYLSAETDENAVCEYSLGYSINVFPLPCESGEEYEDGSSDDTYCEGGWGGGGASMLKEMELTGGTYHIQLIENLEQTTNNETQEEKYFVSVKCTDKFGNSANAKSYFYIDLTELREVMILENITDYEYMKSTMFEIPEGEEDEDGINTIYFAYYDDNPEDNYLYSTFVMEFNNNLLIQEFLEDINNEEKANIENISGYNVYTLEDENNPFFIWYHENKLIIIMTMHDIIWWDDMDNFEPIAVDSISEDLVKAYLEKYPSDIEIEEETPPVSPPSSSSGGGSSSGSCRTNWHCSNWSECIDSEKTRICTKIDEDCRTSTDKPIEMMTCSVSSGNDEVIELITDVNTENINLGERAGIIGRVIGGYGETRDIVVLMGIVLGGLIAGCGVLLWVRKRKF